jgi:predicted transcriptional regulator
MTTKKPQRRNVSFIVAMPPLERLRLTTLASKLGRPISWVVRDAVRLYAEAAEPNVEALTRKLAALDITAGKHVPASRDGRPPKPRRSKSDKKP